ncbi:hypothetical protein [Aeoliella sp.]|uniref:hypothetical protein n=1 Tax=Aeoliella sp. TaxID=2795800 RepID=UPI003CCBF101
MIEPKAINGSQFTVVLSQPGLAMPRELFMQRFSDAVDACISVCNLQAESPQKRSHVFALEQCVFNGTQLFADEVVMAPNVGRFLGDALSKQAVLDHLWRRERFPRYVHLFVTSYNDVQIQFLVQASCCYCSIYDPEHSIPLYPIRACGFWDSGHRCLGRES